MNFYYVVAMISNFIPLDPPPHYQKNKLCIRPCLCSRVPLFSQACDQVKLKSFQSKSQYITLDTMTNIEVPHCCGCGTPVPPSSSGRCLLAGFSCSQVLSAWKNLLHEKLNNLNMSVDDEVSKSGFVCRKCFHSFQSFSEMKSKLMDCIEEAVKYMTTFPNKESSLQSTRQLASLGKQPGTCFDSEDEELQAPK